MEYLIGTALALTITTGATVLGLDRERVFYPAMMFAIATYYTLFAAMGASASILFDESLAAGAFLALTLVGFRTSLWLVVAAMAAHGIFDVFHHLVIDDPGVPQWWPGFCMAFDVVAAGYMAVLLTRRPGLARAGAWRKGAY